VLEEKRMKWVFKHAERTGANRLVLVMPEEWAAGQVRIKDLASGEESTVDIGEL
jgi:histidyl-tRNA synthetase